MGADSPDVLQNEPTRHSEHDDALAPANDPGGHVSHRASATWANVPAGHDTQDELVRT